MVQSQDAMLAFQNADGQMTCQACKQSENNIHIEQKGTNNTGGSKKKKESGVK